MSEVRAGQCLCGGVTVTLPRSRDEVGACHCETCRRWCSGPWMAIQAPEAKVAGETLVVVKSSSFAERGFCSACGSHIFHRPRNGPELAVSAGLFESDGFRLTDEIFHDRKPAFYRFAEDTKRKSSRRMAVEWLPRLVWRRIVRRNQRDV